MHVETQPLCITHPAIEGLSVVVWGDTTVRSINLFDGEPEALRDKLNELYPVGVTVLGRVCRQITDQSVYEFIWANPCSDGGDVLEGLGYDITVEDGGAIDAAIDQLLEWNLIGHDVDTGFSCTDKTFGLFESDGKLNAILALNHEGRMTSLWTKYLISR